MLNRGRRMMIDDMSKINLFSGIEELLETLRKEQYVMYIISSNSRRNIKRFLISKGIQHYFRQVYGSAGLYDKSKLIKKVLRDHGLDGSSALYVGDEVRDIVAARKVNIPCVVVSWGYNSEQLLRKNNPMYLAQTPLQLQDILIKWGQR